MIIKNYNNFKNILNKNKFKQNARNETIIC